MSAKNPELRQDIVSSEWILVAPSRRHRPNYFITQKEKPAAKSACPFEDPQKSGNSFPISWYSKNGLERSTVTSNWLLQVIPNKFPAVVLHSGACPHALPYGLYHHMAGVGFHEVLVYRSHSKFLADMSPPEAEFVIRAYQDRFLAHKKEKCLEYIFIFHNHGSAAGASVWHPHSQIIALPIVPPDVARSLRGAGDYWGKHHTCVHCKIISWELSKKERIIYRNKKFVAIAPFASHVSFEMRIFPLRHTARFEEVRADDRLLFADALVSTLRKLKRVLRNPPYNFFIHTAPLGQGNFDYYHWHLEILPKTSHLAGVELGTGVEVVSMPPEAAAAYLRKV